MIDDERPTRPDPIETERMLRLMSEDTITEPPPAPASVIESGVRVPRPSRLPSRGLGRVGRK